MDPKQLKAAAKAAAEAAAATLPSLEDSLAATKAASNAADDARRAAEAACAEAYRHYYDARGARDKAKARAAAGEALDRLIVRPDFGAELIGALRSTRTGETVARDINAMLARRGLVTKRDRWGRSHLTSLGRDVLALHDEIVAQATNITTTEDR